jgi:hypothetical protein
MNRNFNDVGLRAWLIALAVVAVIAGVAIWFMS